MTTVDILQRIVFPCSRGSYLFSERPALEGVHAFLCAKEIKELLDNRQLVINIEMCPVIKAHKEGKELVISWAKSINLPYVEEVDISVGVADVVVYADDVGIFEIGTTRPTKMLLLLKYMAKLDGYYTVHFWPYDSEESFVFSNWI